VSSIKTVWNNNFIRQTIFDDVVKSCIMPHCSTWNQNNFKRSVFSCD